MLQNTAKYCNLLQNNAKMHKFVANAQFLTVSQMKLLAYVPLYGLNFLSEIWSYVQEDLSSLGCHTQLSIGDWIGLVFTPEKNQSWSTWRNWVSDVLFRTLGVQYSGMLPPRAKVFVHLTLKFICSPTGARVIKFLSLVLGVTSTCNNYCYHKHRYWLI